jgi:hypothetical protein
MIAEAADRAEAAVIEFCQGPGGDSPAAVEAVAAAVTTLRQACEAYASLTPSAFAEEAARAAVARSAPRKLPRRIRYLAVVPD